MTEKEGKKPKRVAVGAQVVESQESQRFGPGALDRFLSEEEKRKVPIWMRSHLQHTIFKHVMDDVNRAGTLEDAARAIDEESRRRIFADYSAFFAANPDAKDSVNRFFERAGWEIKGATSRGPQGVEGVGAGQGQLGRPVAGAEGGGGQPPEPPRPPVAAAGGEEEDDALGRARRTVERVVRKARYGAPPKEGERVEVKSDFDGQTYYFNEETGSVWDTEGRMLGKAEKVDYYKWTHIDNMGGMQREFRNELDNMIRGGRPRYGNRVYNGIQDRMLDRALEIVEERKREWEGEADPARKGEKQQLYDNEKAIYEDLRTEYFAVRYVLRWWYDAVLSEKGGFGTKFQEGVQLGSEVLASSLEWLFTNYRARDLFEGMGTKTMMLDMSQEQNPNVILGKMLRLGSALAQKDSSKTRKVKLTTERGEEVVVLFNPNISGFKDSAGEVSKGMPWLYELYRTHNFDSYLLGYLKTRHKNLAFAFEPVGFDEQGRQVYIFHATDTWFHAYNMWQMVETAPFWAGQLSHMYNEAVAGEGDPVFREVLEQMGWNFGLAPNANIQNLTADGNQLICDNLIYCRFDKFTGSHWRKLNWSLFAYKMWNDEDKKMQTPLNAHAQMEHYMMQTREVLRLIMCGVEVEKNLEKLNDPNECWKHVREPNWAVKLRELDFWDRAFSEPMFRALKIARDGGHRDQVATFFKQKIPEGFARAVLGRLDFAACGIKTKLGAPFVNWAEGAIMVEDYEVVRQTIQYVNELKVLEAALKSRHIELEDFVTYAGLKIKRFPIYNMAFNLRETKPVEEIAANPDAKNAWVEFHNTRPRLREQWAVLNPEKAKLIFKHHESFPLEVDQALWRQYESMSYDQRVAWLQREEGAEGRRRPASDIGKIFQVCMEFDSLGESDQETARMVYKWSRLNFEKARHIREVLENYPGRAAFVKGIRGKLEMRAWGYFLASLNDEYHRNALIDYGSNFNEQEEYERAAWRAERARFGMDLRDKKVKRYIFGTEQQDPRDEIVGRFIRNQIDFNPEKLQFRIWEEANISYMVSEEEKFLTAEELLETEERRQQILEQRFNERSGVPLLPPDVLEELQLAREKERLGLNPVEAILYGTGPYLPGFAAENSILYTDWGDAVIIPRYFVRGSLGFWKRYAVNRARQRFLEEGIVVTPEQVEQDERLDRRVHTPTKRFTILYGLRRVGTIDTDVFNNFTIRYGCTEEQVKTSQREQGNRGVQDMEGKPVGVVGTEAKEMIQEARSQVETVAGFKIPLLNIVISSKTALEAVTGVKNFAGPPLLYLTLSQVRFILGMSTGMASLNGFLTSLAAGGLLAFLGLPRGDYARGLFYFTNRIFGTQGSIERARSFRNIVINTYGGGPLSYYARHPGQFVRDLPGIIADVGVVKWASDDDDPAEKIFEAIDKYKTVYGGQGRGE